MSRKVNGKKPWSDINMIVKMGDEISFDKIEANQVYSVLMLSKGDGKLDYVWGILITKQDGSIVRNYNVNEVGGWDANPVRLRRTWKLFMADAVSRDFALMYARVLSVSKRDRELIEENGRLRSWINMPWWRKVLSWFGL